MIDFASKRLGAKEWPLIRQAYAETYPVRPLLNHVDDLVRAANEVLRVYMPQFNDSRTVDDCLVGLAAAVCSVPDGGEKHG